MSQDKITHGVINASPTKRLFIEILTRDISLKDCIRDLVDNCVDGYTRKQYRDKRLIKINYTPEKFTIYDNCGGISTQFLLEKVFRMGASELTGEIATLGVYGIGLKRSLFKIGKTFRMETDDKNSYNTINLRVPEWEATDDWTIPLNTTKTKLKRQENGYTVIEITDLNEEVKRKFTDAFINELHKELGITYTRFITRNEISIFLNDMEVEPYLLNFKQDGDYKPSVFKSTHDSIFISIICGVVPTMGKRPERPGWNIFCNGRLIVHDDTSPQTGWSGNKETLPKWHQIYNDFRGLVFLVSTIPMKLPVKTTKDGFNTDTQIYQYLLNLMVKEARPVVNYLGTKYKNQESELDDVEDEIVEISESDEAGNMVSVDEIMNTESKFIAPKRDKPENPMLNISYKKPKEIVQKVKKQMGVKSNKAVGEKTFDYYIEMEEVS